MGRLGLSLTLLLTGIVVVFLVLLILTFVIKLYGTAIYKEQNKKNTYKIEKKSVPPKSVKEENLTCDTESSDEIPEEIIVAISAAVAMLYLSSDKKYVIKSVKKAQSTAMPAWAMAGIIENTRPFF